MSKSTAEIKTGDGSLSSSEEDIPGLTEEEFKNSEIYKLLMRDIEEKFPDKKNIKSNYKTITSRL